jgi:hypothetical protein
VADEGEPHGALPPEEEAEGPLGLVGSEIELQVVCLRQLCSHPSLILWHVTSMHLYESLPERYLYRNRPHTQSHLHYGHLLWDAYLCCPLLTDETEGRPWVVGAEEGGIAPMEMSG